MRANYNNGDDIGLSANGCDGCNPSSINGVLCHEHGCPDAWRDAKVECKWCGEMFAPESRGDVFCEFSCAEAYNG
jgi:hypothetical protein